MDEFELIDRFFAGRAPKRDDIRLGIGDDAAVAALNDGYDLVIATDAICEGTHFPAGTEPRALGHRCLAVNLSDLAAMGAEPLWCTLALSLPEADERWLDPFAGGFFDLAERFGIALIGGDTVKGPLAMTVTAHGRVRKGRQVPRSGARSGEGIYITGYTGEAAAGLRLLTGKAGCDAGVAERLRARFLYPDARLDEGRALAEFVTAMIDVSDGLHVDLSRLLDASGVGADLDAENIPLSPDLRAGFGAAEALDLALTGGDDYELCFTARDGCRGDIERVIAGAGGRVTRIGRTCAEAGLRWHRAGRPFEAPDSAYRHFD